MSKVTYELGFGIAMIFGDFLPSSFTHDSLTFPRSNDAESTFNGLNIIKWISMLNEVYEKFDMNDLDCQKKLICEITSEPEYYGSAARSFKTGLQ